MACFEVVDKVKAKVSPKTCSISVTSADTTNYMKTLRTDRVKLLKAATPQRHHFGLATLDGLLVTAAKEGR